LEHVMIRKTEQTFRWVFMSIAAFVIWLVYLLRTKCTLFNLWICTVYIKYLILNILNFKELAIESGIT